ncbi:PH domain-containing protein [Nocardioides sp. Bht2]|uniref:PH domain-containing protein n=1 Tax=Nocardioides sp. Bht2 TaxID=3392297 RepID=UPI0039B5EF77
MSELPDPAPETPEEQEWQRLDPRVLLIGPFRAARQFVVPALVAFIGIGSQQPRALLLLTPVFILGSVALGVLPWLTTRFRIEPDRLVVHTGLLNRRQLTAPIDRVRSVDLEASLLHRLLALRKVEVGTGVDDSRIELDSLSADQAEELRRLLLGRVDARNDAATALPEAVASDDPTLPPRPGPTVEEVAPPVVLATLDPRWARFAPFSLARLAVVAGLLGVLTQLDLPVMETGEEIWDWVVRGSILLVGFVIVVVLLVVWSLGTAASYLITWWDLRLTRHEGNLVLTRGLFTTSSTTVEEVRIRGVEVREPVLLRAVGGAELKSLVTGLNEGVYPVLPQCPLEVSRTVGAAVLAAGDAALHESLSPAPQGDQQADDAQFRTPLIAPLTPHGSAARRRSQVRGQLVTTGWLLPVAVFASAADVISVLPAILIVLGAAALGVLLGAMRYAHLGHLMTPTHLVVGRGTLTRIRTVLAHGGVIGWVMKQSYFQRRQGLVTLVATTAAGEEHVELRDVDRSVAIQLLRSITPITTAAELAGADLSSRP